MKKKVIICILMAMLFSCKKEIIEIDKPEIMKETDDCLNKNHLKVQYQTPYFDWENVDYIQTSYGNKALPWIGGSASSVLKEIYDDHYMREGWVLLYNTCPNSANIFSRNYLIFYNIFRGIFRVYYYTENNSTASNTYWILKYSGSSSTSCMNFTKDLHRESTYKMSQVSQSVINTSSDGVNSLHSGWNYVDFELNYDADISSISNYNLEALISSYNVSVQNLSLQGVINGTIEGSIKVPSTVPNSNLGLLKPVFTIAGNAIGGLASNTVGSYLNKLVKDTTIFKDKNFRNKLKSSTSNLVTDGLGKIFNSFIGTKTVMNTYPIKLRTHEKVNITGTMTETCPNGVQAMIFGIPGSDLSGYSGIVACYNKNLGVWTIDNQPVVKWQERCHAAAPFIPVIREVYQNYEIKNGSYHVIINPLVLNEISHYDVKHELWWYKKYHGETNLPENSLTKDSQGTLVYSNSDNIFYRGSRTHSLHRNLSHPVLFNSGNGPYANLNNYDGRFVVKIIVTLYPKPNACITSYNGSNITRHSTETYSIEPIVMVKTFLPKYEKVPSYF